MVFSLPARQPKTAFQLPNEDWGEWILAAARGDQEALGRLYDRSSRIVFGLISRIVSDQARAEEVLVDVYLHVWRKGETFSPAKGSALAWLVTIARSRAIDALRSRAVRECEQRVPLETVSCVRGKDPDPEEHSAISQRRSRVQWALSTLPKDQREAIELAFFSGLSHIDVANTLGQPLGTVKTRIRLGMARLRESLVCYEEGL